MKKNKKKQTKQTVANPHDAVFRSSFRDMEVAENFFRHYLPEELSRHIDFENLEITNGAYVDEKLKDKHSDIVYKTRIRGFTIFLYLLFEHQSRPDPMMLFRLLCYSINLMKEYVDQHPETRTLPIILPLVLYHGKEKWTVPMHFREMFAEKKDRDAAWYRDFSVFIPDFTCKLYDLSRYEDDRLVIGGSMVLASVLYMFKHIFDEDFDRHASKSLELLSQAEDRQKMLKFLEILLRYIYNARNDDREVVKGYIDQGIKHFDDEKVTEVVMTVADQMRQEGAREATMKATMKTGGILVKLISKRFGNVSLYLKQNLMNSDLDTLDRFGESIFDFKDLKDAERWWDTHR